MSWRFVYDSMLSYGIPLHHWSEQATADVARAAGFKFFTFNGNVFFLTKNGKHEETGIKVDDLK